MPRPTIADIAARVGVSKVAVSYALNGRPGVSEETRRRILAAAKEVGWRPHAAARALSGGAADAVGLVLCRSSRTLEVEPFFTRLLAGIESELSSRGLALVLQLVASHDEECEVYRRWWAGRRADGVLLVDLHSDDPRPALLDELQLPYVVLGSMERPGVPTVLSDDDSAMRRLLEYLVALGHDAIARVCGPEVLEHTTIRTAAFAEHAAALGVSWWETLETDYSSAAGARATRELLSRPAGRPSVVVYDNDVMALAGLSVTAEMGVRVPDDVSIVSWDDSQLCRLVHPPLTSLSRDVTEFGRVATELLCGFVAGVRPDLVRLPDARLVVRSSTAPPAPPVPPS